MGTAERETHLPEQCHSACIRPGGGGHLDLHAENLAGFGGGNLGKHRMVLYTDREIPLSVQLRCKPAEIADPGQGITEQAIQESVHAFSAKRDPETYNHVLPDIEVAYRFPGLATARPLTGNEGD